jgi:hypothetical protein
MISVFDRGAMRDEFTRYIRWAEAQSVEITELEIEKRVDGLLVKAQQRINASEQLRAVYTDDPQKQELKLMEELVFRMKLRSDSSAKQNLN